MIGTKNAFWQALVFTIIVFILGLIMGFFLEVRQSDNIFTRLVDSEINILDNQLSDRVVKDFAVDCTVAENSLFEFADKIYLEALKLEDSDGTGKLKDLTVLHRRYDLLRVLLWLDARELKERCGDNFKVIVYFYEYKNEDIEVASKQYFYSKLLFDFKFEHPDDVILIPIAVDTDLKSVRLIVDSKRIEEFPVIIIDDREIINEVVTLQEFERIVFNE